MGFKKINWYHLIQNGVMNDITPLLSAPQNVQNFDNIGMEIVWTGDPTGTVTISGSVSQVFPATSLVTPAVVQFIGSLNQFPWPYLQVGYTGTGGGTGFLNVYIFGKDLN